MPDHGKCDRAHSICAQHVLSAEILTVTRGFNGLWRTLRERVFDLPPADDLAVLAGITVGRTRSAVLAHGPRTAQPPIHAKCARARFCGAAALSFDPPVFLSLHR
jgi:hypothetical protein